MTPASGHEGTPQRVLSTIDAIAIIVGLVIGAGVCRLPSLVAGNSSSETAFYLLWVAGGGISLIGALCYAELATAYPAPAGNTTSCSARSGGACRSSMPGRGWR